MKWCILSTMVEMLCCIHLSWNTVLFPPPLKYCVVSFPFEIKSCSHPCWKTLLCPPQLKSNRLSLEGCTSNIQCTVFQLRWIQPSKDTLLCQCQLKYFKLSPECCNTHRVYMMSRSNQNQSQFAASRKTIPQHAQPYRQGEGAA